MFLLMDPGGDKMNLSGGAINFILLFINEKNYHINNIIYLNERIYKIMNEIGTSIK